MTGVLKSESLCTRILIELDKAYHQKQKNKPIFSTSSMSLNQLMDIFPNVARSTMRGRLSELVRAGKIRKSSLSFYTISLGVEK